MIGRYLIGLYITYSATATTYGAAGSVIVILVWIYYSAVILYLGAEFTQVATDGWEDILNPPHMRFMYSSTKWKKKWTRCRFSIMT